MLSRRLMLGALGLSGAAAATGTSTAVAAAPLELEIEGCVSWCNYPRGYLKFRPLRRDAAERLIMLDVADEATRERLQKYARPLQPLVLRAAWKPDVDILAPWQAVEVIFANGERFAAVSLVSNIS
jgi:acyl CoA:acetate/3-ketoacid CoA transferase alpha subunit